MKMRYGYKKIDIEEYSYNAKKGFLWHISLYSDGKSNIRVSCDKLFPSKVKVMCDAKKFINTINAELVKD